MQKLKFIDLGAQYRLNSHNVKSRIEKVLDHGQFIFGEEVEELELKLAEIVRVNHCITVGSGTDALIISLMALNIGVGDEVIIPAFTFAATIEAVLLVGATPVLADVDPITCNICYSSVKEKLNTKTKAIIPVSLFGQMAPLEEIMHLASSFRNVKVIEDAAQSFGAKRLGLESCSVTDIACTSFFPSKPLGCYGDGGALFTNDAKLDERIKRLRNHGQDGRRYNHVELGLLSRLDTLQAAVLLAKLDNFEEEINLRYHLSKIYEARCEAVNLDYVKTMAGNTNVRAQFTVFTPPKKDRQSFIDHLSCKGIPTAVHYPKPLHKYKPFKKYSCSNLKNAELLANTVLSLPFHPYISEQEIEYIFEGISEYVL